MKKILLSCVIILLCNVYIYSQFDKPIFQFGIGIVEPFDDLKGTYYRLSFLGPYQIITPDTNLYRNNYGAKTGIQFLGKAKINFDKYNIFRGYGAIGFSTFNAFEPGKSGNIGVRVINYNGEIDTAITGANYNYKFTNFNFGLGIELAPLSFTNVFTPFFSSGISFNVFSTSLSRSETQRDTTYMSTTDLRIGFNFDAGLEYKASKNFGFVLGVKYDLGNILLKNTNGGISDAHEWGKSSASLNDGEGYFYSTIYSPVLTADRYQVRSKDKKINWGTLYVGVNYYFEATKKKTPKKK